MTMLVKMPGETWTAEEREQIRRDAEFCALCNGPSSDTDGGVVLIKASPDFPFALVAMLCSCCIGMQLDALKTALRAKARVSRDDLAS